MSSKHCKVVLVSEDPHVYHIVDSSTNGTVVNGERLAKNAPRRLAEGDRVRLAAATVDPAQVIEYVFSRVGAAAVSNGQKRPLEVGSAPALGEAAKRPASSTGAHTAPGPAPAAHADTGALLKLRMSNEVNRLPAMCLNSSPLATLWHILFESKEACAVGSAPGAFRSCVRGWKRSVRLLSRLAMRAERQSKS